MISIASFTFNPFSENTYLIYDETLSCVIIDAGCSNSSEEGELKNFIEKNGLHPVMLFNTHCHIDHILGSAFVHREYSLLPVYHRLEESNLAMGEMIAKMYGLNYKVSPAAVNFIDENETLKFGNSECKLFFTPGHSAGSLSVYCEKEKILISGDVLFNGSIGRTDLPGGNFEILEQSIRKCLYPLPDETIVYSGHGEPTTIGKEKRSNPFVKF